jgi:hypothetical protein
MRSISALGRCREELGSDTEKAQGPRLQSAARATEPALRRGNGGRLTGAAGQFAIHQSPAWRRRRPDEASRAAQFRIVQRARADNDEVGPAQRLAEERRPAFGAEAAAHGVAAIRRAEILAEVACDLEALGSEDRVDGGIAGRQILPIPAPAGARRDRQLLGLEADRSAEASAGNWLCHSHSPCACRGSSRMPTPPATGSCPFHGAPRQTSQTRLRNLREFR